MIDTHLIFFTVSFFQVQLYFRREAKRIDSFCWSNESDMNSTSTVRRCRAISFSMLDERKN